MIIACLYLAGHIVQHKEYKRQAEAGLEAAYLICKSFDLDGGAPQIDLHVTRSRCTNPPSHKQPLYYKHFTLLLIKMVLLHVLHSPVVPLISMSSASVVARRPHHAMTDAALICPLHSA